MPSLFLPFSHSLSLCFCLCLSISVSFYICLSLCICLFISLSLSLCFSLYLSLCLYFSVCLFLSVSLCLALALSVSVSVSSSLSVCLSASLSSLSLFPTEADTVFQNLSNLLSLYVSKLSVAVSPLRAIITEVPKTSCIILEPYEKATSVCFVGTLSAQSLPNLVPFGLDRLVTMVVLVIALNFQCWSNYVASVSAVGCLV